MHFLPALALVVGGHIIVSVCLIQMSVRSKKKNAALKKKFPYSITKIAHRGGSILGPENTIYTFTRAIKEGFCDMIELDVRESKDGQVVVSHDDHLGAICGPQYADVAVSDMVVGQDGSKTLPQCNRVIRLEFATRDMTEYQASDEIPVDDTTRLCLLREVFERFPSTPLHIDIKDNSKDFVSVVLDLIAAYGRESITFVGSSEPKNQQFINAYFAERGPEVKRRYRLFAGPLEFFRTYLFFYTGLLPYISINYDVFSIPVFTTEMKTYAAKEHGKCLAYIGGFLFSSPLLWRYLQSRGIVVVGWNFNSEDDILEAIQWPLNGVMSDDPIKLRRLINTHRGAVRLRVLSGFRDKALTMSYRQAAIVIASGAFFGCSLIVFADGAVMASRAGLPYDFLMWLPTLVALLGSFILLLVRPLNILGTDDDLEDDDDTIQKNKSLFLLGTSLLFTSICLSVWKMMYPYGDRKVAWPGVALLVHSLLLLMMNFGLFSARAQRDEY